MTASEPTAPPQGVAARLLAVLDAFDDTADTLRLTCIATRTGLPVPTTLRMVRELVDWGGLERHGDGSYRLGQRLWVLGAGVPCLKRVRAAADPHVRTLREITGAAVELAVPEGDEAMLLAGTPDGARLPLHASAVGKVLLADAPSHSARDMPPVEPRRHTPYTAVDPRRLRDQLTRVRAAGYATEFQELALGRAAVAVAVRDHSGRAVGALGVVVATPTDPTRHLTALRRAAADLSGELGDRSRTSTG